MAADVSVSTEDAVTLTSWGDATQWIPEQYKRSTVQPSYARDCIKVASAKSLVTVAQNDAMWWNPYA